MSEQGDDRPLRVVQWATGNIGTRSLRAVIEHPGLELVGLYVHSDAKVGRDAGELCGLAPVGVKATTDIEDIVALKPDCVLYMPQGTDFDALCRLLEAGINVVTTRGDFHFPMMLPPETRERIEAACQKGNASIHSTGSSPGFITEALPIVLTSIARRVDCITIDEFADVSSRNSPELLFEVMGFNRDPATFAEAAGGGGDIGFAGTLMHTAAALGLAVDAVEGGMEVAPAKHDVAMAAGTIEAGKVGAMRVVVTGMSDGNPVIRFRANWYCTRDVDVDWELRESGWRVQVAGDAPLDVAITFPVTKEDYPAMTPGLTAHRPVNAIANVCAAPPGIRTTADMPQVIGRFG